MGIFVDVGLPNIEGRLNLACDNLSHTSGFPVVSSIVRLSSSKTNYPTHDPASYTTSARYEWIFDASRSNAIYGASSTVQPPAFTVRYYIKAA